ncbi:MAG: dihydrolipoyl dehydrogenase [Candidatus Competibacteraceae bacterium]|jgi:dihydrolipoamide dehydrogenase|nr:dihydrolipoyl dehydrogenase [Candidatus Competibacteraceae bacterium]
MNKTETITVPDIGDFKNVDVIEILVSVGDSVAAEDPLISLESDKASMEVPSPKAGTVKEIHIKKGDKVSEGDPIVLLEVAERQESQASEQPASSNAKPSPTTTAGSYSGKADVQAEVVVLGSGPGGYSAAFRAADLGRKTVLVERYPTLGGVCLNVGCIPSKALLHSAKVIDETRDFAKHGLKFAQPEIDLDALRSWKDGVVSKLTGGLKGLAKQRKVQVVQGVGQFLDPNHLEVTDNDGKPTVIHFERAIIAAGSQPVKLPFIPDDSRIVDSTGALELRDIPKRMLVIGGGIIGLEMATVYYALGTQITVAEMFDGLMLGADRDIVRPFQKRVEKRYEQILLKTKVTQVEALEEGLRVTFEGNKAPEPQLYDMILVAVGRTPNGKRIGAEKAGVDVDERGFIAVDKQMRTNVRHICAIGDIIGQPMLAHKAVHEGHVAAEVCAGMKSYFDARVIPSVAYTDPEVAWVGVTEIEAKEQGIKYGKGVFPWAASGRSLALGRDEGMTKIIFDEDSHRIIGMGIVGPSAGDLIAEGALAIEMGCDAADIGMTIHPHPTLSETIGMAAEAFEGTITDLYIPKKKKSA